MNTRRIKKLAAIVAIFIFGLMGFIILKNDNDLKKVAEAAVYNDGYSYKIEGLGGAPISPNIKNRPGIVEGYIYRSADKGTAVISSGALLSFSPLQLRFLLSKTYSISGGGYTYLFKPIIKSIELSGQTCWQGDSAVNSKNDQTLTVYYDLPELSGGDYILKIDSGYIVTSNDSEFTSVFEFRFSIDLEPPVITVSCGENAITKNDVSVYYYDKNLASYGYYECSQDKSFSDAWISFESGKIFKTEGNYTVSAVDEAGNATQSQFTIDKCSPHLRLYNVDFHDYSNKEYIYADWDTTVGGVMAQRCNDRDVLTVLYSYSDTDYPTDATIPYTAKKRLTDEGYYLFIIRDSAGNQNKYRALLDRSPPTVIEPDEFSCDSFTFSATDKNGVRIEYESPVGSGEIDESSVTFQVKDGMGVYRLRAVDGLGNASKWYSVKLFYRETFGNAERIYNSFSLPTWYSVNLPQRIYQTDYGSYSFQNRDDALDFAVKKEWEARVISLDGERWSYVTIANESVTKIYSDRAELDAAVMKYASSYVSDRNIFRENGALPVNPMNADGTLQADALTYCGIMLPDALSQYSGLTYMLLPHDYYYRRPVQGVEGNKTSVTYRLIHNGVHLTDGEEVEISYGEKISDALKNADVWMQGWYLVTEVDLCGNEEQYLVYNDSELPFSICDVTLGDGTTSQIRFDEEYTEKNKGVMRYIRLSFYELYDNTDEIVMLFLEGRGIDGVYYADGDEIPVLSYENGYYGDYTVKIYDRSLNILTYSVRIAGVEPSLMYTSLTNETRCVLTIELNDSANVLTDVRLYKVAFDGSMTPKAEDDDGTVVSYLTLSYVLRVGGKYLVQFTDIYGRNVECGPLFYMKGLPVGTLSGVKENGLTNRDVSFTFDTDCSVILYAWREGAWENADELYEATDGAARRVASITAKADTSLSFKFFLYKTDDMNLFTEYLFEIDKIPPSAVVQTVDGENLTLDSTTAKDFFVNWQESGYTVYYYTKNSISSERYSSGTVIRKAGTYFFEMKDRAQNETTFSITLDNVVSYSLVSSNYILREDGCYISRYGFTLTVSEKTSRWDVVSSNGLIPQNGQKIDLDGTYSFIIEDIYKNRLEIVLIVDTLPPVALITTSDGTRIENGARTNKAFSVSCEEDGVTITVAKGNGTASPYDGGVIDEEGIYTFCLTDIMRNSGAVTVTIDRGINYTVNGQAVLRDGNYYTRTGVSISVNEAVNLFSVSINGTELDPSAKISEPGEFFVKIVDDAENESCFFVYVIKTAPNVKILTASGAEAEEDATVNEPFKVVWEEDTIVAYAKGNSASQSYGGELLDVGGLYTFTVTDFLGNSRTFTVRISYKVDFTVDGVYSEDENGNYVSRQRLSVSVNEKYRSFQVTAANGASYAAGEWITAEGTYSVVIESEIGNRAEFALIIDRTPPIISLSGCQSGKSTRENVLAKIEGFTAAYYQIKGKSERRELSEENLFTEEAEYILTATDFIGNVSSVTFIIDKSVDVTSSIALVQHQIISEPISFTFGETVTARLAFGDQETKYEHGAISEQGSYALTVTDECGNVSVREWTIVARRAKKYEFSFEDCFALTILRDGNVVTGAVSGNIVSLFENGEYELEFDAGEYAFSLWLTVDLTPPTVCVTQEKKCIVISAPSKDNIEYNLFRDGKRIDFKFGDKITTVGNYRLVVTDDLGNENEYEFTLRYLNNAAIALIAVGAFLLVAIIVFFIIARRRQKIK